MDPTLADRLADNVRGLREARGLTQQQISKIAKVPRATWATIEAGGANPTLAVLVKVADALQVRLEELLGPPRAAARHFAADTLPVRVRGRVEVRRLLPESLPGLDIERLALEPGGHFTGTPHTSGTREYLTCERGRIELAVAGDRFVLEAGDVVVFRGDQRHGYRNPGRARAVGYSVVAFSGVADVL